MRWRHSVLIESTNLFAKAFKFGLVVAKNANGWVARPSRSDGADQRREGGRHCDRRPGGSTARGKGVNSLAECSTFIPGPLDAPRSVCGTRRAGGVEAAAK